MTKHIDPVCGMIVREDAGKPALEYKGTTYWFCGDHCKEAFEKDPDKYLAMKPGDRHMETGH